MKVFIILCSILTHTSQSFAQTHPTSPPPVIENREMVPRVVADVVDFPDVDASFPGGMDSMTIWIKENLKYPEISKELGDQGRVYVMFVVNTDGSITDISVVRSIANELDIEAKRLVRSMPNWNPGRVNGSPVRSRLRLSVDFLL